ncbi:Uncharacterised protein [Mycobacteroides abscessus subsp. abscessus]|nr:Uncharacterised protein [Mycobacteroides abscessus subsp. abscessus]
MSLRRRSGSATVRRLARQSAEMNLRRQPGLTNAAARNSNTPR